MSQECGLTIVRPMKWLQFLMAVAPVVEYCCLEEGWGAGLNLQLALGVCPIEWVRSGVYENIVAEGYETDDV